MMSWRSSLFLLCCLLSCFLFACATGTRRGECPAGNSVCFGSCVDLTTSTSHCGSCGTACEAGEVCSAGFCGVGCPAGQMDCGGACVDTNADPTHCGACGNACPSDQVCSAGACSSECRLGEAACGGFCVDTSSNPEHCGDCGAACPVPAGSVAMCTGGICGSSCETGFDDCDANPSNGCEVEVATDAMNCGMCGTVCPDGDGGVGACSAGVCGFTCAPGLGDCDGDLTTVCETDVTSDVGNCGMCANACPAAANATATCMASACGSSCDTGWDDCDADPTNGCETDVSDDESNCGGCGVSCDPGVMCTGGSCGVSCYTGTARILVYGPGGTAGSSMIGGGAIITVATDAMWRTLTTADFGMYDIIFIGGSGCSGTLATVHGTAEDTVAAWGPAVTGRVLLDSGDPDLHGGAAAIAYYQAAVSWLKELGRNADGGRTSLYFSYGCALFNAPGYSAGTRGAPENFSSVFGTPINGARENPCTSVTRTPTGTSHPVLTSVSGFWGCPFHGAFPMVPPEFDTLVTANATGNAVMLAREATVSCTP